MLIPWIRGWRWKIGPLTIMLEWSHGRRRLNFEFPARGEFQKGFRCHLGVGSQEEWYPVMHISLLARILHIYAGILKFHVWFDFETSAYRQALVAKIVSMIKSHPPHKLLIVTMPDCSRWAVPAELIAESRAKHYASTDPETTFEKEFDYTLGHKFELADWAANNMNWSDVEARARQYKSAALVDYEEGWANGHKDVIDTPLDLMDMHGMEEERCEPCSG